MIPFVKFNKDLAHSNLVDGATALNNPIMIIICNIRCSISTLWDSIEQVKLQIHLAHNSWMRPLVVPDKVAKTLTTPISIIITLAYRSTEMLQRVAATNSLVTESSAKRKTEREVKAERHRER